MKKPLFYCKLISIPTKEEFNEPNSSANRFAREWYMHNCIHANYNQMLRNLQETSKYLEWQIRKAAILSFVSTAAMVIAILMFLLS